MILAINKEKTSLLCLGEASDGDIYFMLDFDKTERCIELDEAIKTYEAYEEYFPSDKIGQVFEFAKSEDLAGLLKFLKKNKLKFCNSNGVYYR